MDSKFNLGNLLELGLHNYVDACSEIVDRAQKELIIEKALKKIDETWSSLSLTFSPYQDTDNVQMTVEDSITEALETDNLALQTMSGGKYVQVRMPQTPQLSTIAAAAAADYALKRFLKRVSPTLKRFAQYMLSYTGAAAWAAVPLHKVAFDQPPLICQYLSSQCNMHA